MKFLLLAVLIFATSSASPIEWDEIDWSKVVAREEEPGFWDKVDPALQPPKTDPRRETRIRGGWVVEPNSHPYAVALLMSSATATFRCGSSIISSRAILTAGKILSELSVEVNSLNFSSLSYRNVVNGGNYGSS